MYFAATSAYVVLGSRFVAGELGPALFATKGRVPRLGVQYELCTVTPVIVDTQK